MRRRRKNKQIEHENLERWLVSYADFMTLLFAFFVVMYAISSINTGKYRVLSDSLVESFDGSSTEIIELETEKSNKETNPFSENMIELPIPQEYYNNPENDSLIINKADQVTNEIETANQNPTLTEISDEVSDAVSELMDDGLISIKQDENWLEIEIKSSILFESGGAQMSEDAEDILSKLAGIIKSYPNQLQIEGYTDNVPINTARFPSNWELSSARASSLVHLFEEEGVNPTKMQAIGYGQHKPKASNITEDGRRENRRVVLVVLGSDNTRKVTKVNADKADSLNDVEANPSRYNSSTINLLE